MLRGDWLAVMSESALPRTLAASPGADSQVLGFVPKWRAMVDENEYYTFEIVL
jgi:hypothetical protein